MPTITICAGKANLVPGLLGDAKRSVRDYIAGLKSLEARILTIDGGVCNMDDVIRSIRSSAQIQEAKVEALGAQEESVGEFVDDIVRIDGEVANIINRGKENFYEEHPYLMPDCEKTNWKRFKDGCKKAWVCCKKAWMWCKKAWPWCREFWNELCIAYLSARVLIDAVVFVISTWPYSGMVLLLAGLVISCKGSVSDRSLPPPYEYDGASPQSMADCLGIRYQDYVRTMDYQYGLDERIARLYLKLYLQVANDLDMRGKTEREVACEFNRVIASLCKNYGGEHLTFRLTTGNYRSVDAHKMLMDRYGFSEADVIDFTIALNVQHGFACEEVEEHFGFSRENGTLFRGEGRPTPDKYVSREEEWGVRVLKDLVHEAVQYVKFNDNLDFVDMVSGSTDRIISYSGDIISTSYNDADFMSDIDPNNVQKRLEEGKDNFLKVQQDYNKAVMDGIINPKSEFTSNNGGIDEIRNKINYDIKSALSAYLGREVIGEIGEKEKRVDKCKQYVDAFIDFLKNQPGGGVVNGGK